MEIYGLGRTTKSSGRNMMMDAECWIMDELNIHHPKLIIKKTRELCPGQLK